MVNQREFEIYDTCLARARKRMAHHTSLHRLLDPEADPDLVALFLIQFCSIAVYLARPAAAWMRRCAERCEEEGYAEVATVFHDQERIQAGRYEQLVTDTRNLVGLWNQRHSLHLDGDDFLRRRPTPSALMYRMLHEDIIASDSPYRQVAVEYETSLVTVSEGPALVRQCSRALGGDAGRLLRFMREHVELERTQARITGEALDAMLERRPDVLMPLVGAGEATLDVYTVFLDECMQSSQHVLDGGRPTSVGIA